MYAFTLNSLQKPTPNVMRRSRMKRISSSRSLHLRNLCSNAFTATEKTAESKKRKAASNVFCAMGFKKIPFKGSMYALNGEKAKKIPRDRERERKGKNPVFKNSVL